ncbi:MAG TPA: hypothetical protein VEI03_17010 [Stellaceae bacterium]|nr:hypothetical protein [Stellaceae bacterium]
MFKSASLIAAAAAVAALAATPALAKHKFSCYDYAWESQDLKDCLAHPEKAKAMPVHKAHHKHMKKDMHDMKDMKKS